MPYNSYDIDLFKLAHWMTPKGLRKQKFLIIIKACFYPLVLIYNAFIQYRRAKLYELGINYQVCYLEAFLNDRFDFVQRRIFISDAETFDTDFLFIRDEEQPMGLYTRSEALPATTYLRAETMGDFSFDYIVNIPLDVVFQEAEVRALVASNHSGKRFKIELF